MTLTTNAKRHLDTLIRHGAALKAHDGSSQSLTEAFCEKAAADCIKDGYNAITFDLLLPGIDEPMMLAVWKDGHIDSGSVMSICRVLDR
ncbi:MAG: hypothetical protein IJV41_02540 [Oscillospiraceae bacterium]|nr:hypothetical protein [Oscillospiraceae bacterium]